MELSIIKQAKNKYAVINKFSEWPQFTNEEAHTLAIQISRNPSSSHTRKGKFSGNDNLRLNLLYRPEDFAKFPDIQIKLNKIFKLVMIATPNTHTVSQMSLILSLPGCSNQDKHTDFLNIQRKKILMNKDIPFFIIAPLHNE